MKNITSKRNPGFITLITAVTVLLLSFLVACGSPKTSSKSGTGNSSKLPVAQDEQKEEPQSNPPAAEDEQKEVPQNNPPVAEDEQEEKTQSNSPVSQNKQVDETQSNPPVAENKQEENTQKNEKITLYFTDAELNYMLKETRILYYDDDKTIEDAIVEALIQGPKAEGRTRAILSTVKLIGTKVEDGICYVELSKEFFNENAQGTAGGGMAIGTLVSSLLDRDNIEGVVLVDQGEAVTEYGGHFSFDGPIVSSITD